MAISGLLKRHKQRHQFLDLNTTGQVTNEPVSPC
jgi:hypothetical protein